MCQFRLEVESSRQPAGIRFHGDFVNGLPFIGSSGHDTEQVFHRQQMFERELIDPQTRRIFAQFPINSNQVIERQHQDRQH